MAESSLQITPVGDVLVDALVDPAAPPKRSPLARGFGVGMAGVRSAGRGLQAAAARTVGATDMEREALAAVQAEQEAVAPDVMRVEDVNSFGSALEFGQFALGTAAPSILASILGGVAGRFGGRALARGRSAVARQTAADAGTVAGLAATSTGLETGNIFPEAVEEGVDDPVLRAIAGGTAAGSLDILPQMYLARRLGILGDAARAAPARGFGARAGRAAVEGGRTAALEGLTEAGQEVIGRTAAGQDLTDAEAQSAYLNAAAIGAIAGGTIGGTTGALNFGTAEPRRQPTAAPAQPVIEPEAPLPQVDPLDVIGQRASDLSLLGSIPSPLEPAAPAAAPSQPVVSPYDRSRSELAQEADTLALQTLVGQRETLQAQVEALGAEIKQPTAQRRPKSEIIREIKAVQDQLTQIGVQETQLGNAVQTRARRLAARDAALATPEMTPRTPREPAPESDIIQTRPVDPDTTAAETAVAALKRDMGALVSSREARLVPRVDRGAVTLEVPPASNVRERQRPVDAKTRRDTIEGVAVESIKRNAGELAAAGAFRKGTALKARDAIIAAAVDAAKAPTIEAAEKAVFDAAIKALGGSVNKTDAGIFAGRVVADIREAPKFYSKSAVARAVSDAVGGTPLNVVDAYVQQRTLGDDASTLARDTAVNIFANAAQDAALDSGAVAKALDDLVNAGGYDALYATPDAVPLAARPAAQRAAQDFQDAVLTARGEEAIAELKRLLGDDPNLQFRLFETTPGGPVGYYQRLQPLKDVIALATNAQDIMSVAAHEGFHYLEARVLNGPDRAVINRSFSPGARLFKQVLQRAVAYDRENKTNIADEIRTSPAEARAYGFEMWRRGDLQADGLLARAFEKIRQMIDRIRNYITGVGFQSTEDIFRAIELGAYADRQRRSGGVLTQRSAASAEALPRARSVVDGLEVRKSIPNQSSISASLTDYDILPGVREVPMAAFDRAYVSTVRPDARVRDLMAQIESSGEINPLIVVADAEGYYVLEGGHRFDALIALGKKSIPAQVVIARDGVSQSRTPTDPTDPNILYSRAAAVAESDMARRKRNGELEREQLQDSLADLIDTAGIPNPTLKEVFGATYTTLAGGLRRWRLKNIATGNYIASKSQAYANLQKVLRGYIQRKSALISDGVEVGLSEWRKGSTVADEQAVADALMRRTVGGFLEGSPEYLDTIAELTPKQLSMFKQANETIGRYLDLEFQADQKTMQAALPAEDYAEWLANRQDQVNRLKAEGYVPERRFGDHFAHAYIERVDARGRTQKLALLLDAFETEGAAKLMVERYKQIAAEKMPELKVEYGYKYKAERDTSGSLQLFLDTARRNGVEITQAERERLAKALVAADSTRRNRLFRRKNVLGFSRDAMRVMAEFVVTMSNKVAYSEFTASINDAAAGKKVDVLVERGKAPQLQTDNESNLWADEGVEANFVRNLADELVDYVLVPDHGGEWSSKLRSAAMFYFLGGSVASGVVNMMSVPMNTLPWLTQHTDYGNAATTVMSAFSTTHANGMTLRDLVALRDKDGVSMPAIDNVPGLRDALIAAAEDGTTLDTEIHQIMGLTQGGLLSKSRRVQKAIDVWMWPFRYAEQTNRIATFIAGYKIGQQNNLAGRELYEFAKNTVDQTQNAYNETNRPGAARDPVWSLLFMFKSFPLFTMEMLESMYRQNPKSAVYFLVGLTAVAGVNGLPFADEIMDLADTISQKLFGSPFNSRRALRNMLKDASEAAVGVDLSHVLTRGLINDMFDMNIASRISLSGVIPGTRIGTADGNYARVAEEVLGAPIAMLTTLGTGAGLVLKGEFEKALREAGPSAVRNVIKAAEQYDRGYAIDGQGRKLIDVGGPQIFWQALGFTSGGLAQMYDLDRTVKQTEAYYSMVQTDLMSKLTRAISEGDQAKAQEVLDLTNRWNTTYPDMPIMLNPATLRRRIVEAGMPLNERTMRNLPRALRGSSLATEGLE